MFRKRMDFDGKHDQLDTETNSTTSDAQLSPSTSSLPRQWHLEKTKNGKLRSDLNISTTDGTILNAVSTRLGWRSGVAIYQGRAKDSDYLATARYSTRSIEVSLPGLEAYSGQEIKMKSHWATKLTPRVEWQMSVGRDGHVEGFEWANSSGSWKLTRSGPSGPEIVACCTVSFTSTRLSVEFEFVGAGATGNLGEAFPYIASVSVLAIAKLLRDTVQTYAGVAFAGGAAVSAS